MNDIYDKIERWAIRVGATVFLGFMFFWMVI